MSTTDSGARTVVLTGASDGIGASAARQLAEQGQRLLLVGRSRHKMEAVAQETGAQWFSADFARLAEVRRLAEDLTAAAGPDGVDVLANNAGGLFTDAEATEDGFGLSTQINHLAPFLLTNLLLPALRASPVAAVVTTSSAANRSAATLDHSTLGRPRRLPALGAYSEAKLQNILVTRSLHQRFHHRGLSAVAFHPGMVRTSFSTGSQSLLRLAYRTPLRRLLADPETAGATLTWFATGTPGSTWTSGRYYHQRRPGTAVHPQADDLELAEDLWRRSSELVGLDPDT